LRHVFSVNVVIPPRRWCAQLAEAVPVPGSGLTLPLDLRAIASKCNGCYYAPKRFAAVQLAYSCPRSRVLIFHTGRLVGTGCEGPAAARLAIARAQRQLAVEAGVRLHTRNFQIINQVGAVSLRATLNCEEFASHHRATSHFDRSSFVGLAWRPANESICCEVYSTGRANLPGSTTERDLQRSFARMLPELLRFSSAARLLEQIPEEQQAHHRVDAADAAGTAPSSAPAAATASAASAASVWSGWGDVGDDDAPVEGEEADAGGGGAEDMDDDALGALGL
jgi:TATA-box binding protein (TBP) (component of TFIID and TFIIIB)